MAVTVPSCMCPIRPSSKCRRRASPRSSRRSRRSKNGARAADGHASLNDAVWRDLEHPAPDSLGLLVDDRAYAHVARSDNFAPQHWTLGTTLAPDARGDELRAALAGHAARYVASRGGGLIALWLLGALDADDDELARAGFHPARSLLRDARAAPARRDRDLAARRDRAPVRAGP